MRKKKHYSHEERLQHLRDAYEFVQSGKGTIDTYTTLAAISRTAYYQWARQYSDEAGVPVKGRVKSSNQALVAIGKPKSQVFSSSKHLTVEFLESKISIRTEEELLMVLKAIKRATYLV